MPVRIAIIGTGAIGTSLGMALRANGQDLTLIGHDKDVSRAQEANSRGALDKVEWNLISAVSSADLILLAIPLHAVPETMRLIAGELRPDAVVSDTCTLKAPVQAWADELLPSHVHYVGGNPLVQSQGSGPAAGHANLFTGRRYCLTPLQNTASDAVTLLSDVVTLLGAEPLFLDAPEHDGLISGVSQLPLVSSLALLSATTRHPSWREMKQMASGAYGHATRLPAETAPELAALLHADRDNLLRWIETLQGHLGQLQTLIRAEDRGPLEASLVELLAARARWAENEPQDPVAASIEEAKSTMSPMTAIFGRAFRRNKK